MAEAGSVWPYVSRSVSEGNGPMRSSRWVWARHGHYGSRTASEGGLVTLLLPRSTIWVSEVLFMWGGRGARF